MYIAVIIIEVFIYIFIGILHLFAYLIVNPVILNILTIAGFSTYYINKWYGIYPTYAFIIGCAIGIGAMFLTKIKYLGKVLKVVYSLGWAGFWFYGIWDFKSVKTMDVPFNFIVPGIVAIVIFAWHYHFFKENVDEAFDPIVEKFQDLFETIKGKFSMNKVADEETATTNEVKSIENSLFERDLKKFVKTLTVDEDVSIVLEMILLYLKIYIKKSERTNDSIIKILEMMRNASTEIEQGMIPAMEVFFVEDIKSKFIKERYIKFAENDVNIQSEIIEKCMEITEKQGKFVNYFFGN